MIVAPFVLEKEKKAVVKRRCNDHWWTVMIRITRIKRPVLIEQEQTVSMATT